MLQEAILSLANIQFSEHSGGRKDLPAGSTPALHDAFASESLGNRLGTL